MLRSFPVWFVATSLAVLVGCGSGKKPVPNPDGGTPLPTDTCIDNDGDGVPGTGDCTGVAVVDCNDNDPLIHPGAVESCDGVDNNCNGQIDEGLPVSGYYQDSDGDGIGSSVKVGEGCAAPPAGAVTATGDCDDTNKNIHPGAAEVCNGVDDDCNGMVDDGLVFKDFYPDLDADGFGAATAAPQSSCLTMIAGKVADHTDCNDANPNVHPGAPEACNKLDDNCDGLVDNGIVYSNYYPDQDGDGFGSDGAGPESACAPVAGKVTNNSDCNDTNPAVHPGAAETCNGLDDNCNGQIDEGRTFATYYPDVDGDGYGKAGAAGVSSCVALAGKVTNNTDCNDANPMIHPGAAEVCNGVDDNCDGLIDNGLTFQSYFADNDGDGYGAGAAINACAPIAGRVTNNQDCNDSNAAVKPGALELCNGVDDNCNAQVDEGLTFLNYYPDADGDTFGNASAAPINSCVAIAGRVTNKLDCNDAVFAMHPGAVELCNGVDDNCNGSIDEGLTFTSYYPDGDGDGYGSATAAAQSACAPVAGKVTDHTDCNDAVSTIHPGAVEACNGIDDNCDGMIDNGTVTQSYYPDVDGDGYGASAGAPIVSCTPIAGRVADNTDCNDSNGAIHPGAAEICNGVDDNCVGGIDEGLTFLNYYPDVDGDGYGSSSAAAQSSCSAVSGKLTDHTDCNDANGAIHPGAVEVCNGIDDNCVGGIDEGLPTNNYYTDADGDGFGSTAAVAQASCGPVAGKVTNNTDCNDANANVRPNATETCNGIDDNCTGGIDEGNPGGGGACSTGQSGVCAAGTLTCTAGTVVCTRNTAPSTEKCNGLDDNCDGTTDEPFPTKGQACTAGLGVCLRNGTNVCSADQLSVVCSVTAGAPTPPACDGLDNDCDGVVDEPGFSSTVDVTTTTAWTDLEVKPYYYSAGSCKGGTAATGGTDALVGGAMAMAGGVGGVYLQPLSTTGVPVGAPASVAGYTYTDVDLAQSADGFLVAGLWDLGGGYEIDLYYADAVTGALRATLLSQFRRDSANTGNRLDSLRLVRGNGRRVLMLWRETGVGPEVGIKSVVLQGCLSGSVYSVAGVSCGALPTRTLYAGTASYPAGIGADSSHEDWVATQTCQDPVLPRKVGVSWLTTSTSLNFFTINDDGVNGKSVETVVRTESSPRTLDSPEVTFFRSGAADQYFVADVMRDPGTTPAEADLQFWLTTAPSWHYAYLAYATDNGAGSIQRPRASATASQIWMSAVRYDLDQTGTAFHRQLMTRQCDLTGNKVPVSSTVELSATTGDCTGQPAACRPGNKDAFTNFAAFGRVYYSGTGATPVGTFASVLTCN